MIKWERKLITFLEKHMLLVAALFVSAIAFLMRRQNIWFHTEDYIYYFDMHENHTQSALYYLCVNLTGYVFDLPLHGIKWIAGISDFVVAVLCVILCGSTYIRSEREETYGRITLLLLYTACLFAPAVYLRGCVWAQVDSVAMAFLLGAVYVWKHGGNKGIAAGILLAGIGAALYPPYLLLVVWYCLCCKKPEVPYAKYLWLVVAGMAVLLEICSTLFVDMTPKQGMYSLFQWITYHPHTGLVYQSLADWGWQQILLFSYGAAVVSLIAAFRKKLPLGAVAVLQIVLAACYGIALGW